MADSQTDIRDRIIAWLDDNPHEGDCAAWQSPGEVCDCALNKLVGLVRSLVAPHVVSNPNGPGPFCPIELTAWPCRTIRSVADALGVTP